ncbi:MAG: DUF4129 domain-containing protein, partial [Gammaproteobacteria bacterium]|nr:DUF4129 domain-containing protein [Gammaproteobacteria bacterium]
FPLRRFCPALTDALAASPRGSLSGDFPAGHASLNQLRDVRALLYPPSPGPRAAAHFDYAGLHALLAQVYVEKPAPKPVVHWWQRLVRWLERHFSVQGKVDWSWLERLLARFAPSWWWILLVSRVLVAGAVLFVLASVAVKLSEGRWPKWPRRRSAAAASAPPAELERSWHDVEALPLAQQAPALLHLVIRALMRRGALPADDSLTNRELLTRLQTGDRRAAARFHALMDGVERVYFGGRPIDGARLAALFGIARELIPPLAAGVDHG